jgi:cytochrome c556
MNKIIWVAAVSLSLSFSLTTSSALAADEHHPDQKAAPAKDVGTSMEKMQDNMLKMHEKMHKIMQSKNPAERKQLMKEHMEMMQEHMKMMHEGKGGMMGSDMMDGNEMGVR